MDQDTENKVAAVKLKASAQMLLIEERKAKALEKLADVAPWVVAMLFLIFVCLLFIIRRL